MTDSRAEQAEALYDGIRATLDLSDSQENDEACIKAIEQALAAEAQRVEAATWREAADSHQNNLGVRCEYCLAKAEQAEASPMPRPTTEEG